MTKWVSSRNARLVQHWKINHCKLPVNRLKENDVLTSKDAENMLDKIPHPYRTLEKSLSKLEIEQTFPNLRRASTNSLSLISNLVVKD
jgi:hypothetical protein